MSKASIYMPRVSLRDAKALVKWYNEHAVNGDRFYYECYNPAASRRRKMYHVWVERGSLMQNSSN